MTIQDMAVDVIGLTGVALVSYGAWLIYKPAGFIVLGVLLVAAALRLSAYERGRGTAKEGS